MTIASVGGTDISFRCPLNCEKPICTHFLLLILACHYGSCWLFTATNAVTL